MSDGSGMFHLCISFVLYVTDGRGSSRSGITLVTFHLGIYTSDIHNLRS